MEFAEFVCHRKPERTFKYKNHYFPVCARCTGFYLGIIISFVVLFPLLNLIQQINLVNIGLILLIPMLIDGFTQYIKLRESNNLLRFITGFIGGWGISILIINIFIKISMVMIK